MRFFIAALIFSAVSSAASTMPAGKSQPLLSAREKQVWFASEHHAEFRSVPHSAHGSCNESEPPQEVTAPNPEIDETSAAKIEVSFIVGADGHVQSPLILESADPEQDAKVLRIVSRWRYRPGTCNGVATDSEAKVAFSSH